MATTIVPHIDGYLWLGHLDDPSRPLITDQPARVEPELADVDEVCLHVTLSDDGNALVTVSMTRVQAIALAALLHGEAVKASVGT